MIVTRLGGVRVVLDRRPTGVGTRLWVGEFRDDSDRPIPTRPAGGGRYSGCSLEVRCGRTMAEVLAGLQDTATRLTRGSAA